MFQIEIILDKAKQILKHVGKYFSDAYTKWITTLNKI